MDRMLKSDFRFLKNSKSIVAGPVVVFVGVLFSVIIFRVMNNLIFSPSMGAEIPEGFATGFDVKSVLYAAPSAGFVRLLIILMAGLFVASDFSKGTIKNQIIAGGSRTNVYLSKMTVFATFAVGLVVLSYALTAIFGFILLPAGEWSGADVGYLFASIALNILIAVSYACFYGFLASSIRSTGGAIGLGILIYLMLDIVLTLIQYLVNSSAVDISYQIATFLPYGNETIASLFAYGADWYELGIAQVGSSDMVYAASKASYIAKMILVPTAFIGIFGGLGVLQFNKRDIK